MPKDIDLSNDEEVTNALAKILEACKNGQTKEQLEKKLVRKKGNLAQAS